MSQWEANGPFNIIKASWEQKIDIIDNLEYTSIKSDIYTGQILNTGRGEFNFGAGRIVGSWGMFEGQISDV